MASDTPRVHALSDPLWPAMDVADPHRSLSAEARARALRLAAAAGPVPLELAVPVVRILAAAAARTAPACTGDHAPDGRALPDQGAQR